MPTVYVVRDQLFEVLEQTYTDDEFAQLCFDFGIELDDVTTERHEAEKETKKVVEDASDEVLYKIDIPANRYDLLCLEGLSSALRVFLGKDEPPKFTTVAPKLVMNVKPEVARIRQHVVCAVLRQVDLTPERFLRFIELQTKLHKNICRERTLVSIGTHDLSTIEGPFSYEALPPTDINFVALDKTESTDAVKLFEILTEENSSVKPYLHIIRDSPVYPVIYDNQRRVLSLPPIINSEHSKLRSTTKDIFIEVTATDATKANIVLNTLCAMFSPYCAKPFETEQVTVNLPDGSSIVTPNFEGYESSVKHEYINQVLDLQLTEDEVKNYLKKMMLYPTVYDKDSQVFSVHVPITRSDILNACDIMEDVAIAYGYNNLNVVAPNTLTTGAEQPLNKFSDQTRSELAQCGYWEILTLSLCSTDECFSYLRQPNDGKTAVKLANSKTYDVARTSLLPGLLKTLYANKAAPLPVRLFEVSDVVFQTDNEVGAKNKRMVCAINYALKQSFENIHGLVDRLMIAFGKTASYQLVPSSNPTYFDGRSADILVDGQCVGVFGFLHPEVLLSFKLDYPAAALEMDLEAFL